MLLDVRLLKDLADGLVDVTPPDVLWHYTTIPAAIAILSTSSLHLGCHAFMNDPADSIVAPQLVSECWANAVAASPRHETIDLLHLGKATGALSYFDFSRPELPPTFLFSLTELRDSLSQWSRYGDNGSGVALGFRIQGDKLPGASSKPWRTATELVRVRYDGAKEDHASSNLRPLVSALLKKYLPSFRSPTEVENTLIALMHQLNPTVKREPYYEEREWRIIARTVVESVGLYEIGNNRFGIAPYVPLAFRDGVSLVELILGPKLSPENVWSAKWLCKKSCHGPRISSSALAYR
ncbi:MAG: DUF2971 domain-containing protein [Polyangiaceae bacterium]|nr:DUF2971 domain-containing protein [Polyangiaceae bacterium]